MSSKIVRRKSRSSQLRAGEETSPPGADPGDLLGQWDFNRWDASGGLRNMGRAELDLTSLPPL